MTARKPDARTRAGQGSAARSSRQALADEPRRGEELLSEDELRQQIRNEFTQESLPSVKAPPGWHYCWLSITSQHDPIHKRLRIGYKPVPFDELIEAGQGQGFDSYKLTDGEFSGCVSCNEMVLFKISQERYQLIMAEFHHHMPLEEERALKAKAKASEDSKSTRASIKFDDEDEGMEQLGKDPEIIPSF